MRTPVIDTLLRPGLSPNEAMTCVDTAADIVLHESALLLKKAEAQLARVEYIAGYDPRKELYKSS